MTNIVTANLAKSQFYRCSLLYQYNYGMVLKITGVDLPDAYQVDFSNDVNGTSVTQIGNADGVTIPSQFFVPGQAIYCWLRVHPTQDSGITTATIVIPISPRATITDDEPTPEEQSAIDEAIAALNDAVDKAEDAVEHYPTITGGVWYVWDVDAGEYVSTGIPAQGAQGNPGTDGHDGTDGFSPTATVTQTQTGATISITDKQGTTTANISNGQDGAPGQPGTDGTDGVSPTVTVTDITGGHRITITDATGAHSFDVMDGQDGGGAVQDVQVNGESIVTDGVANVPIMGGNTFGVAKLGVTDGSYGLSTTIPGYNGQLLIEPANDNHIKAGSGVRRPLSSAKAHIAAFYGLAKAAGDTTQSASSNAVGQYTDAAKSAIRKMLDAGGNWEKVAEKTVAEATNEEEVILSHPSKHILIYFVAEPTVGTTSVGFGLYNDNHSRFVYSTFGGQINTVQKTTICEYDLLDDGIGGYVLIDYNLDNASSQMRRRLDSKVANVDGSYIYSVKIGRYSGDPLIEPGSKIIIWAK